MAKTVQERSAKTARKRVANAEEELRLRVRPGTRQALADLMAWTEDTEQASVMAGCLRYVHSLGKDGAADALRSRHKIEVNENVAAELYAIGQRQASRLDAEEV
ncbi:hypothetical protein GIW50_25135 [Pseudomonas syringae]|uniref:Uncharacterized protein n=1 Tax=Pseudomonas syringae TaxID=317 RepID=A0A9Q3WZ96_PSESX|nr:hypothetical protein [Pseudomonas syringae]MCF5062121.1 hypothetical protein [Pseudomonas syringae]MCF5072287.1 hypothetical protein [Pseudomonas syringae]MCF5121686.1 hypothetical protein [Pseudomonas syringae]MCF5378262.1 hypothetical protein [Pseudomonas syringae]